MRSNRVYLLVLLAGLVVAFVVALALGFSWQSALIQAVVYSVLITAISYTTDRRRVRKQRQ